MGVAWGAEDYALALEDYGWELWIWLGERECCGGYGPWKGPEESEDTKAFTNE